MKKQNIDKAIFLDRDGVINEDFGYVFEKENFKFINGTFDALRGFIALGYEIFIITNQSGIARGYYTQDDFLNLTNFMFEKFKNEKISIKKIYFCPHEAKDNCNCRKPNPGMILQACKDFNINLQNSILIGDKQSDIQAGINAGINQCFLIGDKYKTLKDVYDKIAQDSLREEKYEF